MPDQDLDPGVLPTEIRKLVQSRKQVKGLMKDPNLNKDTYMQVKIKLFYSDRLVRNKPSDLLFMQEM